MLLRKLREGEMSQLFETLKHPWCRVPTDNPRQRRPRLGAFIFGVPVILGCSRLHLVTRQSFVGVSIDVGSCVVFRACKRVRAQWDPAASSSAGKCEDDEDGGGILPSSSWARSSEGRGRWWDPPESPPHPGCKQACERDLPSHFQPRPPLRHPTHPRIRGRVYCGLCGHKRGRVLAGWRGRGRSHIREGICNPVCLPHGL